MRFAHGSGVEFHCPKDAAAAAAEVVVAEEILFCFLVVDEDERALAVPHGPCLYRVWSDLAHLVFDDHLRDAVFLAALAHDGDLGGSRGFHPRGPAAIGSLGLPDGRRTGAGATSFGVVCAQADDHAIAAASAGVPTRSTVHHNFFFNLNMFFIELIFITKYPEVWFFKLTPAQCSSNPHLLDARRSASMCLRRPIFGGHPRQNVSKY
jgi:hypothetical protein